MLPAAYVCTNFSFVISKNKTLTKEQYCVPYCKCIFFFMVKNGMVYAEYDKRNLLQIKYKIK